MYPILIKFHIPQNNKYDQKNLPTILVILGLTIDYQSLYTELVDCNKENLPVNCW